MGSEGLEAYGESRNGGNYRMREFPTGGRSVGSGEVLSENCEVARASAPHRVRESLTGGTCELKVENLKVKHLARQREKRKNFTKVKNSYTYILGK